MGALATDYINQPANNSNYSGGGTSSANNFNYKGGLATSATTSSSVSPQVSNTIKNASGVAVGSFVTVAGKTLARAVPWAAAAISAYQIGEVVVDGVKTAYNYFTADEKAQMSEPERQVVEQAEAVQKVQEQQIQIQSQVQEEINSISESVSYEEGQTLPAVMSNNTKALTDSINLLTSALSQQFALLNNNMMAMLLYQQQFLDIKTNESTLKIESLEYAKTQQSITDSSGQPVGNFSPRDAQLYKDTFSVESLDYKRTPKELMDLEGNKLLEASPRVAQTAMHTTVAQDTSDKINTDFDDLLDDNELLFTSLGAYPLSCDIIQDAFNQLKGG